MPKYTTGEIARACGISVRTVQYYDSRKLLAPSEISEGGRRLYSDEDLGRLRIICFLREAGLPIESIKKLFSEEHPDRVIAVLLDEQKRVLNKEIAERQGQLKTVEALSDELQTVKKFTVESIGDIAYIMQNKKKLWRIRTTVLILGIIMDCIELVTLGLWIFKGIWLPYVIGILPTVLLGVLASSVYFRSVAYICPECHTVFKPPLREAFFAGHTPNTRRLTCSSCGHKGFCIETYGGEENA